MAGANASRLEHAILRLPPGARGRHRIQLRVERGTHSAVASRDIELVR
jgi:hypothetical protein